MGRHKKPKRSHAELEALPLLDSQKAIALAYMGEARYSPKITAQLSGYGLSYCKRVVKLPHVMKFLDEELRSLGIVTRAARNATITETIRVSQGDIVEVLRLTTDDSGHVDFMKVKRLPKEISAAIKTIKITEERRRDKSGVKDDRYSVLRTEISMHDKIGALNLLDRMLHISADKSEDEPDERDELKLMGMVIEGPDVKKTEDAAIEAEFEIIEKEKEDRSWMKLPSDAVPS